MSDYRPRDLFRDAADLAGRAPSIWAIWKDKRIEPRLREEVMVAVASSVGCRYCTYSHREILLAEGHDVKALAEFEGDEREDDLYTAIIWAQAFVESGFTEPPGAIQSELESRFTEQEREDIKTAALTMKMTSSWGHEADGLAERIQGEPRPDSRLTNEMLMAAMYFPPTAVVYLAIGIKHRNVRGFFKEFRSFSKSFKPIGRDI